MIYFLQTGRGMGLASGCGRRGGDVGLLRSEQMYGNHKRELLPGNGDEADCFSVHARRLLGSKAGKWAEIKRRFHRRARKLARLISRREADEDIR